MDEMNEESGETYTWEDFKENLFIVDENGDYKPI